MIALAILLALGIGVTLGMLGGGGSILTVPVLVYVLGMEPKAAIATSLVVVGVTSLAGTIQHGRAGNVAWTTGLTFGATGMVGAGLGGYAAGWFSGHALLVMFGVMMIAAGIGMWLPRPEPDPTVVPVAAQTWKLALTGLVVGVLTGLVGAGGGFVIVPALVLLGGFPMKRAVGTSLLVIAMNSAAGFLGHAAHATIDLRLAIVFSVSAVIGSFVGGWLAGQIPPAILRRSFATAVLAMAVVQLGAELIHP